MGFEICKGRGLSCRISARGEGFELQGFGREAPETLRPARKAPVYNIFGIFEKKMFLKNRIKSNFLGVWGQKIFFNFFEKIFFLKMQ